MTDTAHLAVLLAAIAGLIAGRVGARALRIAGLSGRSGLRTSSHYTQGLHYLASGQVDLAASELAKASRSEPDALEIQLVLGNLLRESGQVERAIRVHQGLLDRPDLSRGERAHALVCLGMDLRKAGFIDRATRTFGEVLDIDPKNLHALIGLEKLHEEQRQWRQAYDLAARVSRLRKTEDSVVLGFLQAEIGHEAAQAGRAAEAVQAYETALAIDRRVFPAHLGLADLQAASDPRRAAAILEAAVQASPERAYLAFDRLSRAYAACGEPSRLASLCEKIIRQDQNDWRARLALARHLRGEGRPDEAFGLVLRALEANPQVLLVHLEMWLTLRALGVRGEAVDRYVDAAESSVFYLDPHICTACRYRAEDMLWRCPHCHEWNTFVEERVGPRTGP
jgi:lipopolysaccharide biosynthesis regulator YciM